MAVDLLVVLLAPLATLGLAGATYWDAARADVSRPLLWAAVVGLPFAVGVSLYVFATVPTTGVIMTANTGLVLYGFERGIADEDDDEPAEPGELPHE